jgi:acetate kinase
VGHRVVHGGERYTSAVRITPEVKRAIEELRCLIPYATNPRFKALIESSAAPVSL